jgi:acyl carrier protein
MDRIEITDRVVGIISEMTRVPKDQIHPTTSLADVGIDSLQGLNLLFEVEKAFDISIPDPMALKLNRVEDLVYGLEEAMARAGSGSAA